MLRSLRDDLIKAMERGAEEREELARAACSGIQASLTEELEERLRKHWPRKGRTEVTAGGESGRCGVGTYFREFGAEPLRCCSRAATRSGRTHRPVAHPVRLSPVDWRINLVLTAGSVCPDIGGLLVSVLFYSFLATLLPWLHPPIDRSIGPY